MTSLAIKVLIIVDGQDGFRLGLQSKTDDLYFTIHHLQTVFQSTAKRTIVCDTSHRDLADPDATIKEPFSFVKSVPNLSAYDEIWLFGYNGPNPTSAGNSGVGSGTALTDEELIAITTFMNRGGGVFATGDHASMGAMLCGKIPRVRTMRRWYIESDPERPPLAPPNWPGFGPTRADTLVAKNGVYTMENQSDDVPQDMINPAGSNAPWHPLLQLASGVIHQFPDHVHEGEVLGFGGVSASVPWTVTDELGFGSPPNAQNFVEYPSVSRPERPSHRETPIIIAEGSVTKGHKTPVVSNRICDGNFAPATDETIAKTINLLSVYDGPNVGVGRILTDSSFHHYLDLNLVGDPCGAPGQTTGFKGTPFLKVMDGFFLNALHWLAGPRVFPLVCLGDSPVTHTLYSIIGNNQVHEMHYSNTWKSEVIPQSEAREGPGLACYALSNGYKRVFYTDRNNVVNEESWVDVPIPNEPGTVKAWRRTTLPFNLGTRARSDTPLVCAGPNSNTLPRIYFIDEASRINEFAWSTVDGKWIDRVLPGAADSGSALTCFETASNNIHVYYISNGAINELAYKGTGPWTNSVLPGASNSHSSLTCYYLHGSNQPRVYYIDNFARVAELAWTGTQWVKNLLTASHVARRDFSPLACYGYNGTDARVYFVDASGFINELAWVNNGWVTTVLPSLETRRRAQIACVDAGAHGDVFYMDSTMAVRQLSFKNGVWVDSLVG